MHAGFVHSPSAVAALFLCVCRASIYTLYFVLFLPAGNTLQNPPHPPFRASLHSADPALSSHEPSDYCGGSGGHPADGNFVPGAVR